MKMLCELVICKYLCLKLKRKRTTHSHTRLNLNFSYVSLIFNAYKYLWSHLHKINCLCLKPINCFISMLVLTDLLKTFRNANQRLYFLASWTILAEKKRQAEMVSAKVTYRVRSLWIEYPTGTNLCRVSSILAG